MGPVVTQAAQGCAALRTPPGGSRQRADSRPGVALCSQQGRGQGGGVFLRSQPLKPSHLCAPSTETKTREGDTEAKPARMTRPRLHTQGLLGAARQKPRLLAPHASIRAARPRGAGVRPPTLGTCRPQGPQAAPPPRTSAVLRPGGRAFQWWKQSAVVLLGATLNSGKIRVLPHRTRY